MKIKYLFLIYSALISFTAWSQVLALPNTTALAGEVEIRYRPTFSSVCTDKLEKKEKNDWFAKKSESKYSQKIIVEQGITVVKTEFGDANEYFRFTFFIDKDGKPEKTRPTYETNVQVDEQTKKMLDTMASANAKGMFDFYGKKMKQGEILKNPSICEIIGGRSQGEAAGNIRSVGQALLSNRKAVVFSGNLKESCYLNGQSFKFDASGWWGYDSESGLELQSSSKSEITTFDGKPINYEVKNTTCSIQGRSAFQEKETVQASPDRQNRLKELRKLLDDNLIDKSQYDKKVEEILRGL